MEKNAPEQGHRQFPTQAANDGWLRGWFPAFRAPFLCQQHTVVPDALQSRPWVTEMEVDTLTLLSLSVNASFCTKRRGVVPLTITAKESLPAPGGGQGSAEHALKKEVVKDPVRFWQFALHNLCFWLNATFSDGPSSS